MAASVRAEPSPDVLTDPPRKSFLIIPLHVHVLSCADREVWRVLSAAERATNPALAADQAEVMLRGEIE